MMNLPLLGMGTWGMGGKFERDNSNVSESISALKFGIDSGINLIDTAEIYGQGLTEEIVGEAIKGYPRKEICIVSKVWKTNLHYDDVIKACKASLERLQTDYIDLYLIHWPNEEVPLSETMEAMEYLLEKKYIHNIGVSNFSKILMQEAQSCLSSTELAANQIEYNLSQRIAEEDIINYCKKNGIKIMAYRPLAKGNVSLFNNNLIKKLSEKYNKTPAQIALNWIISKKITVIPKAINREHTLENLGALGWEMEKDDLKKLEANKI